MENNHNKVLVTGANSLLGSNLIRQLISDQFEVVALVRKNSHLKSLEGIHCEIRKAAINDLNLEEIIRDCSIIVHVAANTSQKDSFKNHKKVNIEGTLNLMNAAMKVKVKKFIYVSTANVFGNGSKESPGNENYPFMKWLKKSPYAYSKYLAHAMVLHKANEENLPAIIVNPTFMIGPYDARPSSGKIIQFAWKKYFRVCPPGGKNFVGVQDVSKGIIQAIRKGRVGESYLLSGENLSYQAINKKIDQISGIRGFDIVIPRFLMVVSGAFAGFLQQLFAYKGAFNHVNAKLLCENNFYDSSKAQKELDYETTPIAYSLESAIHWFKENKYLK